MVRGVCQLGATRASSSVRSSALAYVQFCRFSAALPGYLRRHIDARRAYMIIKPDEKQLGQQDIIPRIKSADLLPRAANIRLPFDVSSNEFLSTSVRSD